MTTPLGPPPEQYQGRWMHLLWKNLTSAVGITSAAQSANKVFAGPTSGGAAVPTFRSLVTADMPAGTGTVTSVALTASPTGIFDVSGSPVTTSGTLALSLDNQAANKVLAGPTSGGDTTPAFRALVAGDLPAGTGTVTSVAETVTVPTTASGTNLSVSGSPITTSGTLALSVTPWWFQKLSVGVGESLTVPSGYGCIFPRVLTNNGTIVNNGQLMVA